MRKRHVLSSMKEFISTGALGPIHVGCARSLVHRTLGAPPDWQYRLLDDTDVAVEHSPIWRYGSAQLIFNDEDTLTTIMFDVYSPIESGRRLTVLPWIIRPGLKLVDLESALRDASIEFTAGPDPWNPGCTMVRTTSGVEMIVEEEIEGGGEEDALGLVTLSYSRTD